jgi:hypothetical protein
MFFDRYNALPLSRYGNKGSIHHGISPSAQAAG